MPEKECGVEPNLSLKPKIVMSGFCYGFSRSLLEKLKELVKKDEIYDDEEEQKLTPLAGSIVLYLIEQLQAPDHCDHTSTFVQMRGDRVQDLINLGESFLAIFDKKE